MTKITTNEEVPSRQKRGLPEASIPQADPIDGLLTREKLDHPVTLHFSAWGEIAPGHSYQLTWHGVRVGEETYITIEKPGTSLSLDIPAKLLNEDGNYRIGYAAINGLGGQVAFSHEVPLIVDRTPPGGDLLAPLIINPSQLPLTEDSLSSANNVLTALLPAYFDAKWGDVVRTYWGDQPGPERTLSAEEVGSSGITFTFERSFLEQLKDGDIPVTYTVTDRAGNVSKVSEPALLRLQLRNYPQDLLAPIIPKASDGMIDHDDARHGVEVQIPHYGNAQAGDVIVLSWGGLALPGQVLSEAATQQDILLTIHVSFATLLAAGDGAATIVYEVHREGESRAVSPARVVNVFVALPGPQDPAPATWVNEQLAAPQVRGKSEFSQTLNQLNENDYLLNADVIIPWQSGFKACDHIHLYWGSWPTAVLRTLDQNDIDAAADLVICVPNTIIAAEGVGRSIPVHYTVTRHDNPNTSHSPTQRVQVVSKALLPGGECGLQGALFVDADTTQTLRSAVINEGTSLKIRPYRNMRAGDRIQLVLNGFDARVDGHPIETATLNTWLTLDEPQLIGDIVFTIPKTLFMDMSVGRAEAKYCVKNDYGVAWSLESDVYIDLRTTPSPCR
ncbi:hypothetical protein [Pseudomonas sp. NPDC088444]|uniref:hypothetical protein n=1 Tax=Pseudomonas sp. NPDC088444 TaxID=3364456 RepID=UPI00384F396E